MLPLERILDLATDAIITVDAAQRIVMFNQGAVQIFGYLAQEAFGQSLDTLIPHRVVETHRRHMRDFAAAAEAARPRAMGQQRKVFGRRKDGSEFPAEASIVKHVDPERTTYTVILRDTSARKRVEDELRQAEARHRLLIDSIQDYAIYMLDPLDIFAARAPMSVCRHWWDAISVIRFRWAALLGCFTISITGQLSTWMPGGQRTPRQKTENR